MNRIACDWIYCFSGPSDYGKALRAVFGALVPDVKSAHLLKHAANSFLALKISYINAVSAICETTGADIEQVAEGIGADKRIGRSFFSAGLGYGGSCFPKDLAAFIAISEQIGEPFQLLREVQRINASSANAS